MIITANTIDRNSIPYSAFRIPHWKRRAFTLVEMLVVIAIMVALAGITVAFLPRRESRLATEGAEQLQTFIASARSRALRDQSPRGVRFLQDSFGHLTQVQLLEVPVELTNSTRSTVHVIRDTFRLVRDLFRIRRTGHSGGYEVDEGQFPVTLAPVTAE